MEEEFPFLSPRSSIYEIDFPRSDTHTRAIYRELCVFMRARVQSRKDCETSFTVSNR